MHQLINIHTIQNFRTFDLLRNTSLASVTVFLCTHVKVKLPSYLSIFIRIINESNIALNSKIFSASISQTIIRWQLAIFFFRLLNLHETISSAKKMCKESAVSRDRWINNVHFFVSLFLSSKHSTRLVDFQNVLSIQFWPRARTAFGEQIQSNRK